MKNIIIILVCMLSLFACNRIAEETRVLNVGEFDSVVEVDVPNAVCHKCQNFIEGGLALESGVKQSILNLHTKKVSIVFSPEETSADLLTDKVYDLIPQMPCK